MVAFVVGALAACTGVLLAALETPRWHDRPRFQRFGVALLTAAAAAVAVGGVVAVQRWIVT